MSNASKIGQRLLLNVREALKATAMPLAIFADYNGYVPVKVALAYLDTLVGNDVTGLSEMGNRLHQLLSAVDTYLDTVKLQHKRITKTVSKLCKTTKLLSAYVIACVRLSREITNIENIAIVENWNDMLFLQSPASRNFTAQFARAKTKLLNEVGPYDNDECIVDMYSNGVFIVPEEIIVTERREVGFWDIEDIINDNSFEVGLDHDNIVMAVSEAGDLAVIAHKDVKKVYCSVVELTCLQMNRPRYNPNDKLIAAYVSEYEGENNLDAIRKLLHKGEENAQFAD